MKLIIINGPSGVGKSTAAQALHASMPLSYLIDIGAIGRQLSEYKNHREERWNLSIALAKEMIRVALGEKRDVIVEKMIYDTSVLDDFHTIGNENGAQVTEVFLWASKSVVLERATRRGFEEGVFTHERCKEIWETINTLCKIRNIATCINTTTMLKEEVLGALKEMIKE